MNECCGKEIPFKYLEFTIIDVVNNTSGLTRNKIEDLLLKNKKFLMGTLVTQHQGLNSTHDLDRSKRTHPHLF